MNKIRTGHEVVVLTGKSKGVRGKVTRVFEKAQKVIVSGANLVFKHKKGDPRQGEKGKIIQIEAPIHVSNVAIFNPTTGKADKVAIQIGEDGKRRRVFKSNNQLIDSEL